MSSVYDKLESTLRDNIRINAPDRFHTGGWKSRDFRSYVADEPQAQIVVIDTLHSVARDFNVELAGNQLAELRSQVTLEMTPARILPMMFETMHRGMKCPPGQSPELETVQKENGEVEFKWVCR